MLVYEVYAEYSDKNFRKMAKAGILDSDAYCGVNNVPGGWAVVFRTPDKATYVWIVATLMELNIKYDTNAFYVDETVEKWRPCFRRYEEEEDGQ